MVSNFSVASLFKVSLMPAPADGDGAKPVTRADIEKTKQLCALEPV